MSSTQNLLQILEFLHQAEGLKKLLRHSWLSDGRQESVAEHTWRMSLMAITLYSEIEDKVYIGRVLKMIAIHDLAEVKAGDHHAWKGKLANKFELEEKCLLEMVGPLSSAVVDEICELWHEFEECQTPEARFAQALDKIEVVIQHNEADLSTWNEKEMTYNLIHGDEKVAHSQVLTTFKELIKEESMMKLKNAKQF